MADFTFPFNMGWYVLLMMGCGIIGGIVNIVVSEGYVQSKKVVSEDGSQEKFVFGSIKEPIAGALGAVLVSLSMYENASLAITVQSALIAGFGSSAFLKSYAEKALQRELEKSDMYTHQTDEKEEEILKIDRVPDEESNQINTLQKKVKMAGTATEARFYNRQMEVLVKGKHKGHHTQKTIGKN
ncbi:hypothetical protein [Bacillus sp. 165]|uniref:hypothetical protein n=1 Tax=Bacillus sp. 165 TaxID=1529117 RepID=UPI001ADC2913|nr:hypothetical protein [Bacillus sp. 165]MBO9130554.1 hypothetical protein [Bacillus sp. 165]